ncbi:MAG: ABC transporter substrate-binding protein [Clostridia bacterium]|nr:ABC transporter substrate-binding protein [Clostridia bacterium]
MKRRNTIAAIALAGILALGAAGCGTNNTNVDNNAAGTQKNESTQTASGSTQLKKIRVGHFGTTCEVPLYVAYEKGFFKDEGLDAELIKGDHATLKDGLATGKIDVTDGVLMQWIKPIEQGLNVKFTAGLHTGCLQILLPLNSDVKTVQDFKGKRIGVPAIGGGPMNLVSRLLADAGIDVKTGVTWKAFPAAELELALDKGEVDIIALPDPLAQISINKGKAKGFLSMAKHEPYSHEYCCLVVVNGTIVEKDPETAAAATRAIMKAAKWVSENPKEAAKIEVEKKYVAGDEKVNGDILHDYNYIPSVDGGEKALYTAAKEMKEIGILDKDTDTEALAKSSFVRLKGVE